MAFPCADRRPTATALSIALLIGLVPAPTRSELVATAKPSQAQEVPLVPVDDRGHTIQDPLEICTLRDLERSCQGWPTESPPEQPISLQRFDSLTVEGPGHGPTSFRWSELKTRDEEPVLLSIPRKGELVLLDREDRGVLVSLYPAEEPDRRQPVLRAEITSDSPLPVPAGTFLVSLTAQGWAPDLQVLEVAPGSTNSLRMHFRSGWSLVLRTLGRGSREVLEGARAEVRAYAGYGDEEAPGHITESNAWGLALFSGISLPLASARATHPLHVPEAALAIGASPGTFAFEELSLGRGGAVEAEVSLESKPLAGAPCELSSFADPEAIGDEDPKGPAGRVLTDGHGRCRFDRLPAGPYRLRIFPPSTEEAASAPTVRTAMILEGEEAHIAASLRRIEIRGEIKRGRDNATGVPVIIHTTEDLGPENTTPVPLLTVRSDAEGRFRAVVWASGYHLLFVADDLGTPVSLKRLYLSDPVEEVDFQLAAHEVYGQVLDPNGEKVPTARIAVGWWNEDRRTSRVAHSDEEGLFSIPLEEGVTRLRLQAFKEGFTPSTPEEVELSQGASPPEISLALRPFHGLRGKLLSATGEPVVGAWVTSYAVRAGTPHLVPLDSGPGGRTDRSGQFFAARAGSGASTRIYGSGPGCPLFAQDIPAPLGATEPVEIRCDPVPAGVSFLIQDREGKPQPLRSLVLRRDQTIFPGAVLTRHLRELRLPERSDGEGRWRLIGLSPGHYDFFLQGASSPESIQQNLYHGYLTSLDLSPMAWLELNITVERESQPGVLR